MLGRSGHVAPVVLVVDDNEPYLVALVEYLALEGYQVAAARDGQEALDVARWAQPDAVIMDIRMRGMDGLEAIRRLRADTEMAAIPIIALTALAMPGDRERCLQAGADDYIAKPARPDAITAALAARIGGNHRGHAGA